MKLTYRGVNYDYNPSSLQYRGAKQRLAEVAKARALGAILTYRGTAYTFEPTSEAVAVGPHVTPGTVLTYRGFSYTIQPAAQTVPAPTVAAQEPKPMVKAPVRSIQEQERALTINHHRAMKHRQQVMLARSTAELGVPQTALKHWERIQETFNPAFQSTYDRSHAALS